MNHIAFDFETYYDTRVSVKRMIAEQYALHPECDVYMLSVSDGKSSWAGHPRHFNWDIFRDRVLVAHNAYFDWNVWRAMHKRGVLPAPNFRELHCTANLTSYICNRRALNDAVQLLYGQQLAKEVRADAKGKRWPGDFTPDQQTAMIKYAREDALWCWRLFDDYGPKWPDVEKRLSKITIEQGTHGVQIDTERLNEYILLSHQMMLGTEQMIPWIKDADDDAWEEFNAKPTSTKCIAEQCRRSGIPCCPVKSEDVEAYEEWEATYGPAHPWIYAVSQWRAVNKLYKSFMTIKERLRPDGTMPFGLKYCGAHTGRWTAEGRLNMQNQRKRPVICNEHMLMETNAKRLSAAYDMHDDSEQWPDWVKHTLDFRSLIIPRPGKKMITADLSQIEPRVLAWLAGDRKMLDYFREGLSAYEAHAKATMGWDGQGKLKKTDPKMYQLAKARVLALGYGAGWRKFILMALVMAGLDITKDDPEFIRKFDFGKNDFVMEPGYGSTSKQIVKEFRASNQRIVDFWNRLEGGFKASIGGNFDMKLPSGRVMTYRDVRCAQSIEIDPDTKKPFKRDAWTANSDGKRKHFYGGKLCENCVQATARDVFGEHIAALDAKGVPCLFTVHDEGIFEVDKNFDMRDILNEMSRCPEWLQGCPISADVEEVERYKK